MRLLAIALLFVFAMPVNAARVTSGTLAQLCQSEQGSGGDEVIPGGHAACKGYVLGIIDYHTMYKSVGMQPGVDFCVPSEISNKDIQNVVDGFLSHNPHHGEFLASPSVTMALSSAFPCQ